METKQEHYESMMQAIARYAPSADLEVIQRAYAYADEKHKNQLRKSGVLVVNHWDMVCRCDKPCDVVH